MATSVDKDANEDNKWLCICSDGKNVHIDISVLQQHSDYFAALLRSNVQEHQQRQVSLDLISSEILLQVLELLSLSGSDQFELQLELQIFDKFSQLTDLSEMDALLTVVDYLDIHTLRKLADKFFCSLHEINTENLPHLLHLSTTFTLRNLTKKILSYILDNALDIMDSSVIELLPFTFLKSFIESNKANVSSEWDLVKVLDLWFVKRCKTEEQEKHFWELVQHIRIPKLIRNEFYGKFLEQLRSPSLRNMIKTGLCSFEVDPESFISKHPEQDVSRRGQRLLLAMRVPFGKRHDRACSFSKNFNIINNEDIVFNESHQLSSSIPCDSLREFCVCVLDKYVYVVGGQRRYSISGQFAVSHVHRLDLDQLVWSTVCPMSVSRCLFHMDVIGGRMYAVGGINEDGELDSVERYNPAQDDWIAMTSLDYNIHEHAGCADKENIYVSGGHDGKSHVDTVSCYNVMQNSWSGCAPMLTTRSCHSMAYLSDRLYVIGGSKIKKFKVYGMQSMECYSIKSDQWSQVEATFPSMYTACLSVYTRSLSGKLLVLGGYSYKRRDYTLEMHSFCECTCTWTKVPIRFNSTRKDKTDVTIIEVKVGREVADKLVRSRRSCTWFH